MKYLIAIIFISITQLISCVNTKTTNENNTSNKVLTVYLVRHAEKVDSSRDSGLTPEGMERATDLVAVLKSAQLDMIHSSDFNRTINTALPTADYYELEITKYNHNDLESLAESLVRNGGNHLVVGHSNTTPSMVKLLGGDPGPPINEKEEFDRMYIVSSDKNGKISSVIVQYGQ